MIKNHSNQICENALDRFRGTIILFTRLKQSFSFEVILAIIRRNLLFVAI